MKKMLRQNEGQVGLVVLLIMVVLVTIGVSVATRSVSELRVSRQEQESTRSLNLSESGIEEILSGSEGDLQTLSSSCGSVASGCKVSVGSNNISYTVKENTSISDVLLYPGRSMEINLQGAGSPTSFNLQFNPGCGRGGVYSAVVVNIINNAGNVNRTVYTRCEVAADGLSAGAGVVVGSGPFSIAYGPGDVMARIKVLYQPISLDITGTLPTQTYTINTTSTLADGTTRAVEVTKLNASLPSIFDYVLFSGQSLTK